MHPHTRKNARTPLPVQNPNHIPPTWAHLLSPAFPTLSTCSGFCRQAGPLTTSLCSCPLLPSSTRRKPVITAGLSHLPVRGLAHFSGHPLPTSGLSLEAQMTPRCLATLILAFWPPPPTEQHHDVVLVWYQPPYLAWNLPYPGNSATWLQNSQRAGAVYNYQPQGPSPVHVSWYSGPCPRG